MRNDVRLMWNFEGKEAPSHFKLREFESGGGLVVVDPGLVRSLELLRRDLGVFYGGEVEIVITSGTRTEEDNAALADRLGWVEEGGLVSRDSRHLPKYGGIAADFYARRKIGKSYEVIHQAKVGDCSRLYFRYVKDDYPDGHVHGDNRRE